MWYGLKCFQLKKNKSPFTEEPRALSLKYFFNLNCPRSCPLQFTSLFVCYCFNDALVNIKLTRTSQSVSVSSRALIDNLLCILLFVRLASSYKSMKNVHTQNL